MSFTDIGKSCPSSKFLTSQICLLNNAIRENKVLAIISGFTVQMLVSRPGWSCGLDQIGLFLKSSLATGNHVIQYHL